MKGRGIFRNSLHVGQFKLVHKPDTTLDSGSKEGKTAITSPSRHDGHLVGEDSEMGQMASK